MKSSLYNLVGFNPLYTANHQGQPWSLHRSLEGDAGYGVTFLPQILDVQNAWKIPLLMERKGQHSLQMLKITSHHGWQIRKNHLLPWLEIPFEYIFTWFSLSLCTSKKGGWFFNGDAIIRSKDYTPEIHQELDPWDAPFEDDYWFNSCFWFPYISAIYCQWGDYIYHLIIYHLPPTTY